ncbi:IS1595 family transposase [Synechococcus sp. CBW1002]|jgi:transposase-like protein|uniref:IS1595 family transposase n=1 Tax=Synechococcus sp. CBW1002 TaxID=1353134 RepID=UPI0018CEEC12|nr:IS1595 family transposase [Synechococcus sp. CBW1002]QPN60311.1 IS1595 family transposase [Synechococcus sp. CBW1002]QPN61201.1 IS1595 family transposase [Synechococcus sp. CBW1002]
MARNGIQFQKGLSLPEFQRLYGTEEQCEAALEKARWPDGFRCPRCNGHEHGLVYGRRLKRYQCRNCGHQTTLTAGTILQATKLPLTNWFLAFYLIGQAKNGISSLELSRHLGVNYDTAWLLHNKILRAMSEREEEYLLRGKIQIDDAYLGGERTGGKVGRGSENKIPIVAAVSLNESGHPIHAKIAPVNSFSSEAIANWSLNNLTPGSDVLSDGLACFRAVTTANCHHKANVTTGKHPNDLPQFRWINTLLGNLKTSFNGTFHAFNFDKYAKRYLGGFCFRFNRRFAMAEMTERIANAVCCCMPCTERDLRLAEAYG